MDAIVMLKDDHKEVRLLFRAMEKGELDVVPDICAALTTHAHLEEQVFYPAVRAEVEDSDSEILEALEEHHVATRLIEELEGMDPGDEAYQAKATVLMENVLHHVKEEETELFPLVREALGRKRLQEIGAEMAAARDQLVRPVTPLD